LGNRGYHPIGEAINHDALLRYIKIAAISASEKLETCKAGCQNLTVPKVRVIGNEFLASITVLVDMTIQKAKRIIAPIFAAEGVLLLFLLFVL
jgi:predicted neutral ceramidase superfamily lipid hydrolase